jgi:hypothetical protein
LGERRVREGKEWIWSMYIIYTHENETLFYTQIKILKSSKPRGKEYHD